MAKTARRSVASADPSSPIEYHHHQHQRPGEAVDPLRPASGLPYTTTRTTASKLNAIDATTRPFRYIFAPTLNTLYISIILYYFIISSNRHSSNENSSPSSLPAPPPLSPSHHQPTHQTFNSTGRIADRVAAERERVRMEFYATYDVMTGVRIAATLGGFFGLMVFLVVYKSRGESQETIKALKVCASRCFPFWKFKLNASALALLGSKNSCRCCGCYARGGRPRTTTGNGSNRNVNLSRRI